MAGEKATLKAEILAAFQAQISSIEHQPVPITAISEDQADAIVDAIISAINNTTVVFTLAAPNGPVTGTITLQSTAT